MVNEIWYVHVLILINYRNKRINVFWLWASQSISFRKYEFLRYLTRYYTTLNFLRSKFTFHDNKIL